VYFHKKYAVMRVPLLSLSADVIGNVWHRAARKRWLPHRRRWRANGGNVAVTFAMALMPMLGMVGLAIDVSRTLAAKTSLQAAADAAALAAATKAEATLQANGGTTATAQSAGVLIGQQVFNANATKVGRWIGGSPTPTVNVNPGAANITAFVSFTATVPTVFAKIFGTSLYQINGSASSSLALPKYLNISVVVDISQSMGLAATTAGQAQLSSVTGGCVFGCHVYQSGQNGTLPYETQAHNSNIQLRIDVIRAATQNMITTAQQIATSTPMISFGLYTLEGGAASQGSNGQPLATLANPSTNYTTLFASAGNIDLGPNTSAGIGDTDYSDAMTSLTSKVPTSGSGTSASPQQFVFLMTDGVEDVWQSNVNNCPSGTIGWNGSHCTLAFDPSLCSALKTKGVTIGVIYTTYLPINGNDAYETLVAPFVGQLAPNLQSCASPGWFYQASDANDIQVAINALFSKATGRGVLTQ
jgi:Flp pilus assembly protein TadG